MVEDKPTATQVAKHDGISNRQALMYLCIVVVCFAVLYPRIIHPLVKNALGFGEESETEKHQEQGVPPHHMQRGAPMPGPGMMRPPPGPPPAARGEGGNSREGGGGKGGGMITMILPVYAGGILLYLLYTASKVYYGGKDKDGKKGKKGAHEEIYSLISNRLAGLDLEKVLSGEDMNGADEITKLADYLRKKRYDEDEIENVELYKEFATEDLTPLYEEGGSPGEGHKATKARSKLVREKARRTKDLIEDASNMGELMRKCENQEQLSPEEMMRLQTRLLDMEGKMSKLMAAMKTVKGQTQQPVEGESPSVDVAEQEAGSDDTESDVSDSEISVEQEEEDWSNSDGDEIIEVCEADDLTDSNNEIEQSENVETGNDVRKRTIPAQE